MDYPASRVGFDQEWNPVLPFRRGDEMPQNKGYTPWPYRRASKGSESNPRQFDDEGRVGGIIVLLRDRRHI
jgi:hypothetical protein